MKTRLLAIFILMLLLPMVVLGVLSNRFWQAQQLMNAMREQELIAQQLKAVDLDIQGLLKEHERDILQSRLTRYDPWNIRDWLSQHPRIEQLLVLDDQQQRLFPPTDAPLSEAEQLFLTRTESFREDRGEKPQTSQRASHRQPVLSPPAVNGQADLLEAGANTAGWYVWFWQEGIHLIYWWNDGRGHQLGAEINRVKLLSDIVARLPVDSQPGYRIELLDSQQHTVYRWGGLTNQEAEPTAMLSLHHPLSAWSLRYFQQPVMADAWIVSPLLLLLVFCALVVILLAIYFYRESSRESRDARQRVTFVNQVSHELKTPLTNIRLYAELLEQSLDEEQEDQQQKLGIIISEAERLSRMIGNVLTFARQARQKCQCRPQAIILDTIVREVVAQFALAYRVKAIAVALDLKVGEVCWLDRDMVEQVLGNLLSNVEKYAASGGQVSIATRFDGAMVVLQVSDAGPGIPDSLRKHLFEPFVRAEDSLTEGVSGTGIGLSIARELMILHGGSLELLKSTVGAVFAARFPCRKKECE